MTETATPQEFVIRGLPVSLGIESGPAYVLQEEGFHFPLQKISEDDIDHQIERLERAWKQTIEQIEEARRIQPSDEDDLNSFIDLHLMLAKDLPKHTRTRTLQLITQERMFAETAFHTSLQEILRLLGKNPIQRAEDVADIGQQVIRNIVGKGILQFDDIVDPVILIADDLSPSLTARLPRNRVLGFATQRGSRTSHTAIMARALEIPAVVGLVGLLDRIEDQDQIIVDGDRGRVVVNPTSSTVKRYEKRQEAARLRAETFLRYRDLEAETLDGFVIKLPANIELPEEVEAVMTHGGWGIGLYRTEFLFLNRPDLPTEEEQYLAYRAVGEGLAPKPVTLRTLDIGGDKFLSSIRLPREVNPFMGLRGIRFTLEQPEIFKTQIRAILRASHYGNLAIMFPMISEIRELREAIRLLEQAKEELQSAGLEFDDKIQVGAMIEVPSAALMMKGLAPLVDFFSIGTNDLIQYTLAVDRGNERTSGLYNPLNPGVLRLVQEVVEGAHAAGKKVCMCGEMAGELSFTLLLVGLLVDELSMSPIAIPEVKRLIRSISLSEAVPIAHEVLQMDDPEEIRNYLDEKTCALAPWFAELLATEAN